jgi:hypothetical protein
VCKKYRVKIHQGVIIGISFMLFCDPDNYLDIWLNQKETIHNFVYSKTLIIFATEMRGISA